ncbi:protein O-mannosyltransferase 1 isoform X1 [Panulirus ornatus]|uniref:protein O-mannosyltransferase 1 isoform X1 n=2 Tax=Panulirus ornatus TaxID=150431 RepID=UPI003A8AD510
MGNNPPKSFSIWCTDIHNVCKQPVVDARRITSVRQTRGQQIEGTKIMVPVHFGEEVSQRGRWLTLTRRIQLLGTIEGDGESAPDTPPPETAPEDTVASPTVPKEMPASPKTSTQKSSTHKKSKNANKTSSAPPPLELSLRLDGMSVSIFVLSFITRIWKLETPRGIVFDELHYGKYAGLYMQNTFFFDSQPPLGKQLIALAAYIAGFDGNFKFDRIGTPYDPIVPVSAMRMVPAFFGSLLMPTVYNLMVELGLSHYAGGLAAFLLIFDNAVLAQSRFILMEGILMFFGVFGLLCILKFRRFYRQPYSLPWFACLILGAASLGACFCVRYFGIFTFLLGLGILTRDFWMMVGDRLVSERQLLGHLLTRAVVFITIPLALYIGCFYVHLSLLYKAGPNDNIMTSAFQASLEGGLAAIISNQPVKVVHGSQITLRHTHGRTCWLHSHDAVYPVKYPDGRGSSHQQQVTCYSYKDVNNWWIIKKPEIEELVVTEPHEPIKHGDIIQIVHGLTSRALNAHDVAAAMSPHNQEVAAYIDYNVSMPAQTHWRVDLLNSELTDGYWHAVESQIRLIHVNSSQALKFSGRQLPDWGFRQHEIVTDKVLDQEDTIWNVEEHRYTRTDDKKEREKDILQSEMIPMERKNLTFWNKLFELQYKMLFNNQENVAGHMYASEPLDWLSLKRGVAYWISANSNAQIHFIGNVVTWLSGTLGLIVYIGLFLFYLLRRQRACYDLPEDAWNKYCTFGEVLGIGYAVHYFPYFLVDRTLFLHHYMPAYLFKLCLLAAVIEHGHYLIRENLKAPRLAKVYVGAVGAWMVAILYVFWFFAPVTYGTTDLTADEVMSMAWRDTWDLIIHKQ